MIGKYFDALLEAAMRGDANAQYNLGVVYYRGKQLEQAEQWFRLAADQGSPDAEFMLSVVCGQPA